MTPARAKNIAVQGIGLLLAALPFVSGALPEPWKSFALSVGSLLVGLGFRPAGLSYSKDAGK